MLFVDPVAQDEKRRGERRNKERVQQRKSTFVHSPTAADNIPRRPDLKLKVSRS